MLITDRRQASNSIPNIAEAAFSAGCRWLSLREKDLPEAVQGALLRQLLDCARPYRGRITLHGDARLARDTGIDGVHLAAGGDVAEARRMLGQDALIGLSIHSAEEAQVVDARLLDYVIAGPVFPTQSKPGYGPALGPEGLALIAKTCPAPVIAIGGIEPKNIPACLLAGAAGVAVMGSVMRAKNPAGKAAELVAALTAP